MAEQGRAPQQGGLGSNAGAGNALPGASAQAASLPAAPALPVIVIKFEAEDGRQLAPTLKVRIPSELSLRVAKMHLIEYVPKQLKPKLDDILKGMGFK